MGVTSLRLRTGPAVALLFALLAPRVVYNMLAIKDYSTALTKITGRALFAYQPETQGSAGFLKSKLGEKVRLERFDGAGHALFVDEPEKFNRVLEDFLQSLPQ